MKTSTLSISFSFILLLPLIYCHSDHDKGDWIKYLPDGLGHILKSHRRTTTTIANEEDISQNGVFTETQSAGESTDLSDPPEIMNGYNDSGSSSSGTTVGVSVGGIIIFLAICYCCFRVCCRSRSISQGVIIQPLQPPPDPNQRNIVIQHIHASPNLQPVQPAMVQHIHQSLPPHMVQHAPQYHQQPDKPPGYEARQVLQHDWSPHEPMNQYAPISQHDPMNQYVPTSQHDSMNQYAPINQQAPMNQPLQQFPYNPSAPPPSYGKY